jgi:hypothetical protein
MSSENLCGHECRTTTTEWIKYYLSLTILLVKGNYITSFIDPTTLPTTTGVVDWWATPAAVAR